MFSKTAILLSLAGCLFFLSVDAVPAQRSANDEQPLVKVDATPVLNLTNLNLASGTMIYYRGSRCDVSSDSVNCAGTCVDFRNHHSVYLAGGNGGTFNWYTHVGCSGYAGSAHLDPNTCYNVNVGTIEAASCS